MGYRTFASMNIAIIGENEESEKYVDAFAIAGHDVLVANKEGGPKGKYRYLPEIVGIHPCSIEDAAAIADFILIVTPARDVREVAYWLGDVRRKVIIDLSANVTTGENEPLNTVGAIQAITGSQSIVKCFNTAGYEQLLKPLFNGERPELVLAGDCRKAKEITKIITKEMGINRFYDFGGMDNVPLLDELANSCKMLTKTSFFPRFNPDRVG